MAFSRTIGLALGLALTTGMANPAGAAKGIGPYYSMKYNSLGTSESMRSRDGKVVLYLEEIETINCGGCDTVLFAPGRLLHLKNITREPICAKLEFTPVSRAYGLEKFGSGTILYLKGGKMAKQVGGLFYVNSGQSGSADVSMDVSLRTWQPIGKNQCGAG